MSETFDRSLTIHVRVHWKTPVDSLTDKDTDEVYDVVKKRIEHCLASNICGQVGEVPGTTKMELIYGTVI